MFSSRILVVGEAFGAKEERQGKPFVGRSWQLLRKALKEAGFDENYVDFTNVCRFRPPNNRKPTSEEIRKEIPELFEELRNYQHIISVGVTARKVLDKLLGDRTYFCLHHPSYVLRGGWPYDWYVSELKAIKKICSILGK